MTVITDVRDDQLQLRIAPAYKLGPDRVHLTALDHRRDFVFTLVLDLDDLARAVEAQRSDRTTDEPESSATPDRATNDPAPWPDEPAETATDESETDESETDESESFDRSWALEKATECLTRLVAVGAVPPRGASVQHVTQLAGWILTGGEPRG